MTKKNSNNFSLEKFASDIENLKTKRYKNLKLNLANKNIDPSRLQIVMEAICESPGIKNLTLILDSEKSDLNFEYIIELLKSAMFIKHLAIENFEITPDNADIFCAAYKERVIDQLDIPHMAQMKEAEEIRSKIDINNKKAISYRIPRQVQEPITRGFYRLK